MSPDHLAHPPGGGRRALLPRPTRSSWRPWSTPSWTRPTGGRSGRLGDEAPPHALVVPHAGYVYSGPVAASRLPPRPPPPGRGRVGSCCSAPPTGCRCGAWRVPTRRRVRHPARRGARRRRGPPPGAGAGLASSVDDRPARRRAQPRGAAAVPAAGARPRRLVAAPHRRRAGRRRRRSPDLLDRLWGGDRDPRRGLQRPEPLPRPRSPPTASTPPPRRRWSPAGGTASTPSAACGAYPLRGLLNEAEALGLDVELLDLRTSADTAGDPDRVVGYGAFAVG